MTDTPKKKCFVISPIGDAGSDIRTHADFFRHEIVAAALPEFDVERADDFSQIDQITNQVIQAISDAHIIVADLTGSNANVFYELGVAHSYKKHVVPMIVEGKNPPFDNMQIRTVHYSLATYQSKVAARNALAKAVEKTLGADVSNPVTLALGAQKLAASGDDRDTVIARLEEKMNAVLATQPQGIGAFRPPYGLVPGNGASGGWLNPLASPVSVFNPATSAVDHARTIVENGWLQAIRERLGTGWEALPDELKSEIMNELRARNIVQIVSPQTAGEIATFRVQEYSKGQWPKRNK